MLERENAQIGSINIASRNILISQFLFYYYIILTKYKTTKRLKLEEFTQQKITPQQEQATQKILDYVLGNGPKRPRHCPSLVEEEDTVPPNSDVPGTVC